jgi:hypothetical protein
VCIYGATSAGVVAAVQASKLGKKAVVVEAGGHVGGMTTSGLGATDTGNMHVIGSLSRQFYRDIGARYGKDESHLFEPHVASAVFQQWMGNENVEVLLESPLSGVKKEGNRIVAMEAEGGRSVEAAIYIDATYEGDLMAGAGVSFATGRESDTTYTELYNGIQYGHQHNFLRFVDPYRVPGDPGSGLLYGVSAAPLGTQGSGDSLIQAYNFRLCLTRNPENKVPFFEPEGYDPDKYELLRRYIEAGIFDTFNLNTPLPNDKTDYNNWGAINSDHIGANYGWPEGSYEERERIYQDHLSYQAGLLYFLATDPRLPAAVRAAAGEWGLAADEFTATGNWPPQLYVREARRMTSDYVMTEHDSFGRTDPDDSIGMATYRMDSHNCKRVVYAGRAVNEGDVEVAPLDPIPIPYRAIRPKRSECANLLVPVCISASHIAYGCIRMEPVFMVLGQSAAVAAVIAMEAANSVVQDISYTDLERKLTNQGVIVREPNPQDKKDHPGHGKPAAATNL